MEEVKFKIINKTKTECTMDLRELGKVTLGWPAFNKVFKLSELYWAEEKPEYRNRVKELKETVDKLLKLSDEFSKDTTETREKTKKSIEKVYDTLKSEYSLDSSKVLEIMASRKEYIERKKKSIELPSRSKSKKMTLGDLPVLQKLKAEMEKK